MSRQRCRTLNILLIIGVGAGTLKLVIMPSRRTLQTVPSTVPESSEPTGLLTARPGQNRPWLALGASAGTRFRLADASWSVCAQTHRNSFTLTIFPFPWRPGRLVGETSVPSTKQCHGPGVSHSCLKRCGLASGPKPGTRCASVLFCSSPEWRCGDVSSGRSPLLQSPLWRVRAPGLGTSDKNGPIRRPLWPLQRCRGRREAQVGAGLGPRRPGLALSPAPPPAAVASWQHGTSGPWQEARAEAADALGLGLTGCTVPSPAFCEWTCHRPVTVPVSGAHAGVSWGRGSWGAGSGDRLPPPQGRATLTASCHPALRPALPRLHVGVRTGLVPAPRALTWPWPQVQLAVPRRDQGPGTLSFLPGLAGRQSPPPASAAG